MITKTRIRSILNLASTDSLKYLFYNYPLIHYWDHEKNWGDSINKFIFESILSREVLSANRVFNFKNQEIITGIGSVLNSRLSNYSIWGSGFLSEEHGLIARPNKVLAVRGKLTQKKIKDQFGINCQTFGDPGFLFKDFYNPDQEFEYSIGIIPHFKEMNEPIVHSIKKRFSNGINVIDPRINIFEFANEVKKCEKILSSSLHGLILAESYGIPTSRIILSEKLIGGDFKFKDYYSGVNVNIKCFEGISIQSEYDIFSASKSCSLKDIRFSPIDLKESLLFHFTK